jgi:thioesterase domain-containing protein/acyl carrier protein
MFLTTALFNQLAAAVPGVFQTVRHVLFGGEAVDSRQVREALAHEPPERLLHVYGPTEATTFSTWYEVREVPETARTVPIGRPIANTQVYVLDKSLAPVPVGVPGELYIGGAGLARGHLGRPGLTAERFVPDPCGPSCGQGSGGRLYRTGDRVRWRPDGTLEFLGRLDQQVKIRGYRIEPGEIEAVLSRHPAIRDCAVVLRNDMPGGHALVAYLSSRQSNGASQPSPVSLVPELRAYLRQQLPEYMIPSALVVLPALPLSPNGKIDVGALPVPTNVELRNSLIPASTSAEKALTAVWQELLGVDCVSVDDNFFELGGHSLLAVRLFAEIERIFGRKLPLSTLFQAPTPRKLAEILAERLPVQPEHGFVVLRAGGTRPPLFVVHGVYGHVLEYRDLVNALGPDQPVYGFEAPQGTRGEPVLSTIEQLAARYVQQLRARQPYGPYYLCGYCWAGPLTCEIARQLQASGQEIGLLVLIDSQPPLSRRSQQLTQRSRRTVWKIIQRNLRRLDELEPAAIPQFLRERVINLVHRTIGVPAYRLSVRLQLPLLPIFRQMRGALLYAGKASKLQGYYGRVTLIMSRPTHTSRFQDYSAEWARLATDGLEVREVSGEHLTIMQEPYVHGLASELRECLTRAHS